MSIHIIHELYFLMHAMLMGMEITLVYDGIRILRRVVKHNLIAVSIEDMIFWIGCSISIFLLFYQESNGSLRWFAILGATLGMLFYKATLSYYVVTYTSRILNCVQSTGQRVLGRMLHPMLHRLHILHRILRKRLTLFKKMVKIMLCKQ
ncbi:MAG: spore cortex biosynthesis protein YabQ [Lachnospiraceae bacterium]